MPVKEFRCRRFAQRAIFVVDLLTKNGYQVTTAENGEEGSPKPRPSGPTSS